MSSDVRFDGRVVIVTGAGAGLGKAYAMLFASRGASVVVNDLGGGRNGDGSDCKVADTVVEEIRKLGGKAVANCDSVLDGSKIVKTAIDAFGRIDIVVNNAGILRDRSFARMSEGDWDIIQDVHVKGAVKTTQAAWPYFRKQGYGRIIVTSSNSGLYGNFGQANYSAAKSGLIGFAKTLAIEGAAKNIHTNVIVPTAGSRLTEDIIPADFWSQLKPELIAPVVMWLCHEECTENGAVIESALGWAAKYELIRSVGSILRQDINAQVTPEAVRDNWKKVTDMSETKHCESIRDATIDLSNVVESLKNDKTLTKPNRVLKQSYNYRDSILYAIGVGCKKDERSDFRYLYENHESFALFPTFYTIYGPMSCISTPILEDVPGPPPNLAMILHGEQYLKVFKPLPTEATVETRVKIQDTLDKGKNAVVLIEHETFNTSTGEKLTMGQMALVIRGAGGFSGLRKSIHEIPTAPKPTDKPDAMCEERTSRDQAVVYRLSGDLNPLHIDPAMAQISQFKEPILHGLSLLGFATRHVLNTYAGGNPELFDAIKVRFAKHVIPGESLRTDMWQRGSRIHFETVSVERNEPVINGAYIDLKRVVARSLEPNKCFMKENLESDAIFTGIMETVRKNPSLPMPPGGIFLYDVTSDGELKRRWTVDLKRREIYEGLPYDAAPDAALRVDDRVIIQTALGQLDLQKPFLQRKIGLEGDTNLLQTLKLLTDNCRPKL